MHVSLTVAEWQTRRKAIEGCSIGFVPTMGALHEGHRRLVERCRAENDVAAVSIFVNPSQFNDPADLDRYPDRVDQDLALLQSVGVDDVFMPHTQDIYPQGYRLRLEPQSSDLVLEGAYRPGSLQGMMTIVLKLFNLLRADRAYFGEKDFQQLTLVRELVEEFFVSTEIVACETVRELSGLAMSSRNALLSPSAHEAARFLFHALNTSATCTEAKIALEDHGFRVEYVEERWGRRLAAAWLDGVRLIDNIPLLSSDSHNRVALA